MYNVYFTVVEMMFVNFCTHLCKVRLPVCIFVNLSLTIMCFLMHLCVHCTLHVFKLSSVAQALCALDHLISFFLSGLCLMMKDAVCITLTTRLTPPLKGRLL